MIINRNTLGHLEEPQFILCKASGERVGILKCTEKKWEHKYNELDTLAFDIPFMTDGVETASYDMIDIMKYIEVPDIGAAFAIKDVEMVNEGQDNEYKSVSCESRECELAQKYLVEFTVNYGTTGSIDGVSFYSPGNQTQSLLHMVITEKCPGWTFNHISASLRSMKRSFEVSRQDIYSFLTKDVAEAFDCIFVFDSLHKTVSAYTVDEYGIDTNVHLSYNNLLEKAELSLSIDEIKTCVTIKGDDDLSVREINRGYDSIYGLSYWATEEYWSQSLLNAYNAWNALIASPVDLNLFTYKSGVITRAELSGKNYDDAYTVLLAKYQNYYTKLSEWNSTLIPYLVNTRKAGYGTISYTEDGSDAVTFDRPTSTVLVTSLPSSGDANTLYLIKDTNDMYRWNGRWVDVNKWYNCCLAILKEKLASFENNQAVAMKAGYGDAENTDTTIHKRYIDTYLPALYSVNALTKQIETVKETISGLEADQAIIQTDKTVIVNKTDMKNNFTAAQLKELSTFIREEELSTNNYVVTDVMTEDERFEMLYALLDYAQKELAKVSTPQLQFTVDMANIFAIPEFDIYSGDFDLGNYVWVTIRDDYSIKAKILGIEINFMDQSQFSVTFGNVARKARNIFTDVTEALNTATAAATSVSFSSSHWSAAAEETDSIGQALADGLLGQSYYLANAEDNETLIDENGVWITTTTGSHGRLTTDDYDAIYLGGGRILFTSDGWRSVSMSVGRADVQMPSINTSGELIFTKESLFGTFADFIIAGYVAGSTIVGGDIYSSNYKTSSNKNSGNRGAHISLNNGTFEFNNTGKKRLTLNSDGVLEVNGVIQASSGHIGSDDNGEGGFIIENKKLYNGKSSFNGTANGIYLNSDEGISLGSYNSTTRKNPFSVTNAGYLVSTSGNIGGWEIANSTLKSGNITIDAGNNQIDVNNVFTIYNDGSFKAANNTFSVSKTGYITSSAGTIGGWNISADTLSHGNIVMSARDNQLSFNNTFVIYNDGSFKAANSHFSVATDGTITSTKGKIGGWNIDSTSLSANNITISSSGSITHNYNGVSNWSIQSSGYAYFKNVFITGVNSGSTFGYMGYDGSAYNYGTFGGSSWYSSGVNGPFGGTCITHIQSISADYIYANYLEAMYARIGNLEADNVTIHGTLDAHAANIDNLWAESANIRSLVATEISATRLYAEQIGSEAQRVSKVYADQVSANTLSAAKVYADNVSASIISGDHTYTGSMEINGHFYFFGDLVGRQTIDGITYLTVHNG